MSGTIFERYGGFAHASRVVAAFYDGVLSSPTLAPFFDGVDMPRLMDHQTKFIAFLMGGPASFTNEHLARVHARLGITDAAFDEIVAVLRETLEDLGYDESDIAAIHSNIAAYRPYVVAPGAVPSTGPDR